MSSQLLSLNFVKHHRKYDKSHQKVRGLLLAMFELFVHRLLSFLDLTDLLVENIIVLELLFSLIYGRK